MSEETQEANKKNNSFLKSEKTRKIVWSILVFLSGMIAHTVWDGYWDNRKEYGQLKGEIRYNINAMKPILDVLDKYEVFFESEFRLEEKKRITEEADDLPPRMFYIDSPNKDNPIWKSKRIVLQFRNSTIKRFIDGKLYEVIEGTDIDYLDTLDNQVQRINDSLIGVYISIDELSKRSKLVTRREKIEELKRDIENKRKGALTQIKQLKTEIDGVSHKLTSIRDSVKPGFIF